MIEKNQELEVEISGVASEGQGIARINGFVIFVPFAMEGEVVKIHIIKVTKSFAVGKIMEIVKPAKERVEPICPHFYKCGGCSLQHMSKNAQLSFKKQVVKDALRKLGGFNDVEVDDVIASDTNVSNTNTALTIINIASRTIILVIFTAIVPAVSDTISFCVFVTVSLAYFSK